MAATLAKGTTVLENAAREPEVTDLANCLVGMGAKISIETGTYAMAVAMTGGDVLLKGAQPDLLQSALDVLIEAGVTIEQKNDGIRVARNGAALKPVKIALCTYKNWHALALILL